MEKLPCLAPFTSLTVRGPGMLMPCCAFTGGLAPIKDVKDLKDFFFHDAKMQDMRAHEMDGRWYMPGCLSCKKAESSSRKVVFKNWMMSSNIDISFPRQPQLLHLGIDFSNVCNMTCVMCDSSFSSSWIKPEKEFNRRYPDIRYPSERWTMTKDFADQLLTLIDTVKVLEIRGGEPLLDPQFEYFMGQVLEKGRNDLEIALTTNFSAITDKKAKLLSQIKNGLIDVSIDGVGKTYEWIRGFSFSRIEEKLNRFLPHLTNQQLTFNYTTSIYNILNIEEFYHWTHELGKKLGIKVSINYGLVVKYPDYLSPRLNGEWLRGGLRQIENIKNDPLGYNRPLTFQRGLEILKNNLLMGELTNDLLRERQKIWHDYLVELRGWDIYDHTIYSSHSSKEIRP